MSLAEALLAFQADAPKLRKDATNPHFGSKFVSLDSLMGDVLPKLNAAGLALLQMPTTLDGQPALRTRIIHAETGEAVEDVMLLNAQKPDPQAQGSAITYARRYAIAATLGLVADEDDDGNSASRSNGGGQRTEFKAPESATNRQPPGDGGDPAKVVLHFSKNAGKELGELTPNQLKWYAEDWTPRDGGDAQDRRLKIAAQILHGGGGEPLPAEPAPDDDIPF